MRTNSLPKGWTETDVRAALAVNQKNLEVRRTYLAKLMRDGAKELDEIDQQLSDIAQSIAHLNQR